MRNAASAVPALCAAISAVQLVDILNPRTGASNTVAAQAPPLHGGIRDHLLLLASAGGLFTSAAFIYRHVVHRSAANRRLPEIVPFMLCVCVGALQHLLFVQAPGGVDVAHGARARALGLAALRVMPAAATVTFSIGTTLIVAAHIRAGGEGGGTSSDIAVAGEEPIQAPVELRRLREMALAAASGLLCLMAIAVYGVYY